MKSIIIAAVLGLLPLSAGATSCPQFSGTFQIEKIVSGNEPQTGSGAVMVLTQSACASLDVKTISKDNSSVTQDYFLDGQSHPFGEIHDVGVSFTMTAQFVGDDIVGYMGMASLPGQKLGTIKFSLSNDGKTLTYSMNTPGSSFTATASRKNP